MFFLELKVGVSGLANHPIHPLVVVQLVKASEDWCLFDLSPWCCSIPRIFDERTCSTTPVGGAPSEPLATSLMNCF